MSNLNTSQQWQTAARNLEQQRDQLDNQFDALTDLNLGLAQDTAAKRRELNTLPLGSARRAQLDREIVANEDQVRINEVKQGEITTQLSAVNVQISAAQNSAAQSLQGLPNTNATTPPATVQPNTAATSVPPIGEVPTPQLTAGTVPPDDPQAGEFEAQQFLLDRQPAFVPAPVIDDNLAFESTFDDDRAFRAAPTVPRDDPQAGEFEAGQFVTAQQLRSGPQPVTVLDPDTGQPVETLASIEARQQFRAQETGISPYGEEDDPLDLPAAVDTAVSDTTGYIVADGTLNIPPDGQLLRAPTALGGNFSAQFDPETQTFGVFDNDTGEFIQTGLTQQQATLDAEEFSVGDPNFASSADATDPGLTPDQIDQQAAQQLEQEFEAARQETLRQQAREQAALREQQRQVNLADWRVRLTLAPDADYLYMDPGAGDQSILYPLKVSNGVIFPYTPRISTSYRASYENYDLTHSNYRGYFYKGSAVDAVSIGAMFTAQDTSEANYVLAVIHFFRAVTRMFYGANDPLRGTPPPLVFLRGLGQYQFNEAPCVVSSFNYNLPNDVDYIRAGSANTAGLQDLNYRRNRAALPTNVFDSATERLRNAGIPPGAEGNSTNRLRFPDKIISSVPVFGMADPTYVPTKIEIEIELLPMQSRQQISKEYNFGDYASGKLITRGYW